MSTWEFVVRVEVDDEKLAAHEGDESPPPNNPYEWEFSDLVAVVRKELVCDDPTVWSPRKVDG